MVTLQTNLQIKHIVYARLVTRPIFNHFLYFFVRFFMWSTDLEAKDASSLLPPYPRSSPRGTAIPINRQVSLYSLLSYIQQPFMQLPIIYVTFLYAVKGRTKRSARLLSIRYFPSLRYINNSSLKWSK